MFLKNEKEIDSQLDDRQWLLTFSAEREIDEEESKEDVQAETCQIRVDLLKMPEETDPIAVKFTRVSGNAQLFEELFKEIQGYFDPE